MGQKTHPYGFRLGYNNTWRSRWYADGKEYANLLHEDLQLRDFLRERLANAAVSAIDIERTANKLRVNILSGRPGIIIGRKGAEVDKLRDDLMRRYGQDIHINIQEIQRPEIDAHLIAGNVARQLERRIAFRRAMRRAIENALRFGAQGIKIRCAGRLNGAEIARCRVVPAGASAPCTPSRPISTMDSRPHTPPTASSASRCGSIAVSGIGRETATRSVEVRSSSSC